MGAQGSDFAANVERFTGFAGLYDRYRPGPPSALASILTALAQAPRPRLVVDLGSGTGLSSRYWARHADRVIGVEPTADMRRQAEAATPEPNVSYREGYSHATGLDDHCADIVSCSQALHWMEPESTFREAARILRPGGVFAASDYDWPPVTGSWEADAAYEACMASVREHAARSGTEAGLRQWDKPGHLGRMRSSGRFRYVREIVLHSTDHGNAERLVGLLLSQGVVMSLLKAGNTEEEIGVSAFRAVAERALGPERSIWYWCARLRVGIT